MVVAAVFVDLVEMLVGVGHGTGGEYGVHHGGGRGGVKRDVDEAGACHLDLGNAVGFSERGGERLGFMPAFLASCMAMLEAQSPCARSFGRITASLSTGGISSSVNAPAWPAATRLWAMLEISSLKASGLILLRILRTATLAPWYAYMLPLLAGASTQPKDTKRKRVGDNRRNRWRLAETAIHTVGRYL